MAEDAAVDVDEGRGRSLDLGSDHQAGEGDGHDSQIACMIEGDSLDETMVDLMGGFRAAGRHLDRIMKGLTLGDGHAGGVVESRPRRSLWAEITAHNDLRISVFRGHAPRPDKSLDALAPMRKYSVDRHRILQIKGGGRLFEVIPDEGFYERTLINLHADIGEIVVDLWDLLVERISAAHDLQEGDTPILKHAGQGRRLTMTTAEGRDAVAEETRISRAAGEAERRRDEIQRAEEFIAALTGDPVKAAHTIAGAKRSKRSTRQETIRPALISCGLLSEREEATDSRCDVLAAKVTEAVRLAGPRRERDP